MNPPDYFFIVGCPRSGTTLLSVLLDRNSRLCVTPETSFFDEIAPQLSKPQEGLLLKVLSRWRRLGELKLEPAAVLARLGHGPYMPGQVLAAILDLYAEARGKARCGEKTPQHLFHVPTILRFFPQAKVVCLMRDGRETALSLSAMPWFSGRTLEAAAVYWKNSARLADQFSHQFPGRFQIQRYEDLVAQPEEALTSITAYLGETFEPRQLGTDIPSEVVLARSMRWKGQALQAIDPEHLFKRSRAASAAEVAFLNQFLRDELRHFAYGVA